MDHASGAADGAGSAEQRRAVLIDAAELMTVLHDDASGPTPALLDVRWALGRSDGPVRYAEGHLPGAVYVDLDTELAAPPTPAAGRHPLPATEDLQRAARRWGLRMRQPVVVYDDNAALSAARAWWLLRWGGLADVRILDGGLAAWTAAGGTVEHGAVRPAVGDVVLRGGAMPVLDAEDAADLARRAVLLDARAVQRYRGEVEPIDPRAGHIPGARSAATQDNLDADGCYLDPELLRAGFAGVGATQRGVEIGVYCGSGVTAAHEIAALASIGITASLYPGSWSQWSADPARPVATGSS